MSGCVTSDDSPAFGWASPGQPCSGHGTCLNVSSTQYFCQCDPGYNGIAEWFDLRAQSGLAFDCPTDVTLYTALWALNFAFIILRQITLWLALLVQRSERASKKFRSVKERIRNMRLSTRVLIADSFIGNPLMLWCIGNKLFILTVNGTDASITIPLIISTATINIAFTIFTHDVFMTLTKGALLNAGPRAKLERDHLRVSMAAGISYIVLTGIPSIVALGLDKANGPIVSGEYIIILCRNAGMVFWLGFQSVSSRWFLHQTIKLLDSIEPSKSDITPMVTGGSMGSTSDLTIKRQEGARKVVEFLKANSDEVFKQAFFGCIVWAVAMIPHFWPFQGYFMAIMSCLASYGSNSGLIILRSHLQYWRATAKTDSSQPIPPRLTTLNVVGAVEDNNESNAATQ